MSFKKDILKELRKTKIRRPDIVVECAPEAIKNETVNEGFNLQEQVRNQCSLLTKPH